MMLKYEQPSEPWLAHPFCEPLHFHSMSSTSTSSTTTPTSTGQTAYQRFHFVDCTPKSGTSQKWKGTADNIRVQAARASAQARIDTMRKRAEGRKWKSGEGVFSVHESVHETTEPEIKEETTLRDARQQKRRQVARCRGIVVINR